jgi:hypothetical protein
MNDGSFRDAVLLLIVVIFFWINQQPTIFFPWLIDEILYEMVLWCTGVLCVEQARKIFFQEFKINFMMH